MAPSHRSARHQCIEYPTGRTRGERVSVTGISGAEVSGETPIPVIRTRPGSLTEVVSPYSRWHIIERSTYGGVFVDPEPERTGETNPGEKEAIVESRPAKDSLSWSIDIREDEEQ